MHELEGGRLLVLLLGVVGAPCACASTEASAPEAGGAVGNDMLSTAEETADPDPVEGTQTGGEGDALNCGEGPPNWQPVSECIPFPTHYAGALGLDGGGSVQAELTLSNLGAVYALELLADAGFHPACGDGRQGELDWDLNVDGVLRVRQSDRVVYSEGYRGELGDTFDLGDVGIELVPPTADDFRAAGDPAPWAPGDGPVRVDVYLHLGDATANVELRWSCWSCGSSRVALPLARGTLRAGEAAETRVDTPNF